MTISRANMGQQLRNPPNKMSKLSQKRKKEGGEGEKKRRMAYLQSNIPYFKAWVRREYTKNLEEYHGEFLHAMVVAVTTMPNRTLSFQVIFTGCESDDTDEPNVHGGAMWARMPLTALVADTPYEEWPTELPSYVAQPWDCMSHHHSVYKIERASPAPWIAKVDDQFYPASTYLP